MEPIKAKIRKITAAWEIKDWYIKDGYIYIRANNGVFGFNIAQAGFDDCAKPEQSLNLVLEIPCP